MNTITKRFGLWMVMVNLVLAGCAGPVETQLPPTQTVELSSAPETTPTVQLTAAPTQEIATKAPEPSLIETMVPTLTVREPSAIELNAYLETVNPDLCYGSSASDIHYQDL